MNHPARRKPLRARRYRWPRLTRDGLMLGLGTFGFVHEVVIRDAALPERFSIIAASIGLMFGVPLMRLGDKADREEG